MAASQRADSIDTDQDAEVSTGENERQSISRQVVKKVVRCNECVDRRLLQINYVLSIQIDTL